MKFVVGLLAVLGGALAAEASSTRPGVHSAFEQRRLQQQFMAAMNGGAPDSKKAAASNGKSKSASSRQVRLNKRILSKARRLDQGNGEDYQEYGQYNYDNADNVNGGDDDYNNGNWYNEYYDNENGLINLANYAFKYTGCSSIQEYDEEAAREGNDNGGSAIVTNSYAVFSLCPVDSCSSYTVIGCGQNYGQYLVQMGDYLEAISEYYEERYNEYCEYCETCSESNQANGLAALEECFEEKYQQQIEDMQANGDYNYYNYAGNMAANNYYNGNGNYNGNRVRRNRHLDQNNNGNDDAAAGNDYNYNSYNNNYDQNAIQMAQAAYGYYDENGGWVEGDQDAFEELQEEYAYMGPGVIGADGQWYPADSDDECVQAYFEDYGCDEDKAAICDEYSNYCYYEEEDEGDDANNNNNGNDFEINYDECMKYENQYGRIFYFAPHCGSDHFTITLGVFADENCGTYMGEEYSIGQILGRDDDFDSMFLFPKECIYCNGQDKLEGYNQDYNEDNDEEEQADEEDGAVEMCQRLYEEAGTCNVNLNAWQNMYKTSSQITQEENSCNFIAEIRSGKYEEGGDITISSPSFDLSNWRDLDEYKKFGIPLVELAALVGSILLVLVLSIILCLTQRELNALDTPWRPKIGHDLINVSRQNSGIGLARSRSAPGNTPLI